ncbi:MAG TPA: BatD family protein [Candidatus Eisenbacteria bacterium]|nr:BatD family protein [Candidatus Eisenbacteria bacterium]
MTGERSIRVAAASALLFAALAALAIPSPARAAIIQTRVSVDPPVVMLGEPVNVTVTVESDGFAQAEIVPPSVAGLSIERAGTSQNLVMGAGSVVRTDVSVFRVTAATLGKQKIPSFEVVYDRKVVQTGPALFETVSSLPNAGAAPRGGDGARTRLFARIVVDRRHVWWNEQIVARIQVYSRSPLEDMPTWEPPEAAGFWSEPLGDARHGRVEVEGEPFELYERIFAFFPTRPGRLALGPARARVRVLRPLAPVDDPILGFFPGAASEVVELPVESAPVDIAVDPLPRGAPPGFRGAVGRLALGVRVDRPASRVGEAITVSTSIRGEGNLASAADPTIVTRPAAPSYPAGAKTEFDRTGDRVRGVRRRDVAFVPDRPGSLLVLPIEFAWFDPEEGRYRVQRSDSIVVRVSPAKEGAEGGADVASTAMGVPAPPRPASRAGAGGPLTGLPTGLPLAVWILSLSGYAVAGVAVASRRRAVRDPKWRRARLAEEAARRVDAASREGDAARAAERTEAALRDAAGIRFGIDPEGRSRRDLLERLRAAGVGPEEVEEVTGILGRLERGAFAPGGRDDVAHAIREATALAARWRDACRS